MKSDQTVYRCDRCDYMVRVDLNAEPDGYWWDLAITKIGRQAQQPPLAVKLLCRSCSNELDRFLRESPVRSADDG